MYLTQECTTIQVIWVRRVSADLVKIRPPLPARVLVNERGQFEALGYEAEQIYAQEIEQGFPRRENIRCLLQRLRCDLSA